MVVWVDGFDGWMIGWVGGLMVEWLVGWRIDGWMVGWVDGLMDEWLVGWLAFIWLLSRLFFIRSFIRWLVGWMDWWMNGWLGGWIDGWMVGWVVSIHLITFSVVFHSLIHSFFRYFARIVPWFVRSFESLVRWVVARWKFLSFAHLLVCHFVRPLAPLSVCQFVRSFARSLMQWYWLSLCFIIHKHIYPMLKYRMCSICLKLIPCCFSVGPASLSTYLSARRTQRVTVN